MRQALARKATGWLGNEASSVIKEMAEMARGDEEDDTNAAISRDGGAGGMPGDLTDNQFGALVAFADILMVLAIIWLFMGRLNLEGVKWLGQLAAKAFMAGHKKSPGGPARAQGGVTTPIRLWMKPSPSAGRRPRTLASGHSWPPSEWA